MYKYLSILATLIFLGFSALAQNDVAEISIQQGHMDDVVKITISPDLAYFATYGLDDKIILWDYKTGSQMAFIYVPNKVTALQFDAAENKLYYTDKWGAIYALEIATMQSQLATNKTLNITSKVAINLPNETCTIKDAKISWVDIQTNKKLKTLTCDYYDQPFTSLVYASLQQYAIAACQDGFIYVYDKNKKLAKQLKGHNSDVNDLAISNDQKYLFSVSTDRSIIKWNLETLEIDARYAGKNYPAYGLSVNPNGNNLMYGDELGNLKTVDLQSFRLNNINQKVSQFPITHSIQYTDSTYLFAGNANKLWINRSSTKLSILRNINFGLKPFVNELFNEKLGLYQPPISEYTSVNVNKNARLLVTANSTKTSAPSYIRVYDLQNGEKIEKSRKLYTKAELKPPTTFFLSDSILFTHYSPSTNKLWKIQQDHLNEVFEKELSLPFVTHLVARFSNDEIIVFDNKNIHIFHLETTQNTILEETPAIALFALEDNMAAYSTAHNTFYTITKNNNIPQVSSEFVGHQDSITSIVYNREKLQIITASMDGSVKIWDATTSKLILTIVAIGTSNCLYITPDNYYMMSNKGLESFGFKKQEKFYYPEQFDALYNRPDIVLERLGFADDLLIDAYFRAYQKRLKKLGFSEDMLQPDFHLPQIAIQHRENVGSRTKDSIVQIEMQAMDTKYKLDRVNIWVNDVAVFGTKGINLKNQDTNLILKKLEIPLANGKNKIEISCINQAGAESYKENFNIICDAGKAKPDLYIITMGISEYQDNRFNLKYAAKDAKDMINSFAKNPYFGAVYSRTLTDKEVTFENIQALKAFLAAADINDQVIIFVAGHGLLDENFDYYFASYAMDFEKPALHGIPYEAIEELLDGIKPLKKLLFMDTCHSGEVDKEDAKGAKKGDSPRDTTTRGIDFGYLQDHENHLGLANTSDLMRSMFTDLRKGTGSTVISASGGLEFALESNVWKNGLFTFCLINGLSKQAADQNHDGEIWLNELQQFVFTNVNELSNGRQTPTFRIENKSLDYRIW